MNWDNSYLLSPRGRLTRVGGWELGKTLGRGTYAHVRLATHMVTGRTAACKILPTLYSLPARGPPSQDDVMDAVEAHKELVLLKAFEGARIPGTVHLQGVVEEGGWNYIFLSLHPHNLSTIPGTAVSEVRICGFFAQLLRTLEALHALGVSHEDLKRANVLVDIGGGGELAPVLADFGFSHFRPHGGLVQSLGGTADYSSPLKLADGWYQPKANDVWSLGIMLLKLRGYPHPFLDHPLVNNELADSKKRIMYGQPVWSFKRTDLLENGFAAFIQAMMNPNEEKRATVPELLSHPYLTKRVNNLPPAVPIPGRRLTSKVSRPVLPVVLQDLLFLAYLTGDFVLCETPKRLEKRLYGRGPCWEQQWATMLTGWERTADLEWEDQEVSVLVAGQAVTSGSNGTHRTRLRPLKEIHLSPLRAEPLGKENRPRHSPSAKVGVVKIRVAEPVTPPRKVLGAARNANIPIGIKGARAYTKSKTYGFGHVRVSPAKRTPTKMFPKTVR